MESLHIEAKWHIYAAVYQDTIGSENGMSPAWC